MSKQVTIVRRATEQEVAAYKVAVAPFVAAHDTKAIIDLRCRMGMFHNSRGMRIRVRVAASKVAA